MPWALQAGAQPLNRAPQIQCLLTCPHVQHNFTVLGGGKTFHPNHPPDWDGTRSWSNQEEGGNSPTQAAGSLRYIHPGLPYFDFSYYKENPSYKGPCPGAGGPESSGASKIDTWCAIDEPDDNFYDHGLATNTITQLRHAAMRYNQEQKPFFIQAGFARPHAPWRVPQRFWDLYNSSSIPLATHKLPPNGMPARSCNKSSSLTAYRIVAGHRMATGWIL